MKLEFIAWRDARGSHADWFEIGDVDISICTCKSVGWLAKETDEFVHLVPHLGDDPVQGCGDMAIPKSAIVKRVVLKEPKL